jgi:hypothetical protein
MSSAYKAAMLQTFCIPVSSDDPDAASTKLRKTEAAAEPVQGWEAWVRDIIEMMGVCESKQAVRSVQSRQRSLLASMSRERPDLYRQLGESFATRIEELSQPKPEGKVAPPRKKTSATKKSAEPITPNVSCEPADG